MKYINILKKDGFERKLIVDFLIGATETRTLTIEERKYISEYLLETPLDNNTSVENKDDIIYYPGLD